MSNDHFVCSAENVLWIWGIGRLLKGEKSEISKEAVAIVQVTGDDGVNQGASSTDGKNALGKI